MQRPAISGTRRRVTHREASADRHPLQIHPLCPPHQVPSLEAQEPILRKSCSLFARARASDGIFSPSNGM